MTDTKLHPSLGGSAAGYAFELELGVAVLRGARAISHIRDEVLEAVTAENAAEAQERLELVIDAIITNIRLYDHCAFSQRKNA